MSSKILSFRRHAIGMPSSFTNMMVIDGYNFLMSRGQPNGCGKSRWVILTSTTWLDDLWDQTALPKDGKPFGITLYADKTRLSSFGTAQGYPIMAQLVNLPQDIRNGRGLGSTQVVGWLPIVSDQLVSCKLLMILHYVRLEKTRIDLILSISSVRYGTSVLKVSLTPSSSTQSQGTLCTVGIESGAMFFHSFSF